MTTLKNTKAAEKTKSAGSEYRGRQTKTGNSLGFRFEGALFKSHPEFSGEVRAHVIAPGRLLVTADVEETQQDSDPVLASFLAFLAQDMASEPHKIRELSSARMKRIAVLTNGLSPDDEEELGDDISI